MKEPHYETEGQKNTRRQELGRGLLICVNQQGERVFGDGVNVLTVVCPDDFAEYTSALQKEYVATDDVAPQKPTESRKAKAVRNNAIFGSSGFGDFWKTISRETRYEINLDSQKLIARAIAAFNDKRTEIPQPKIILTKGEFVITKYNLELKEATPFGAAILLTITDNKGTAESGLPKRFSCGL